MHLRTMVVIATAVIVHGFKTSARGAFLVRPLARTAVRSASSSSSGSQNAQRAMDERFMKLALRHAQDCMKHNEVPVGAVLVANDGTVLAGAGNTVESSQDASAHAELRCMRAAGATFPHITAEASSTTTHPKQPTTTPPSTNLLDAAHNSTASVIQRTGSWRMHDCTLYVTLQPCDMCTAAIKLFRVKRLVFGAYRPEKVNSKYEIDNVEVEGGVLREQCAQLLSDFFRDQRKAKEKSRSQAEKT